MGSIGAARAFISVLVPVLLGVACSRAPSDSQRPVDLVQARAMLASGDARGVVSMLRDRTGQDPERVELLAQAYESLPGSEDESAARFAPLGTTADPRLVIVAARAAARADQLSEAESMLKGLLAKDGNAEEVAIEYAKLISQYGRYDDARRVLEPFERDEPRILNLLGYTELLAGRLEPARQFLERSISVARSKGGDYAPAYYHLGLYHRRIGDLTKALEYFRRACGASPSHLTAHYQWMAAAEELGLDEEMRIARHAFGRIYRGQLAARGALNEVPEPVDPLFDRAISSESRKSPGEQSFHRRFPAGASLEIACQTPGAGKARYRASIVGGPDAGRMLLDVVHEASPIGPEWVPHHLSIPAGAAGEEVEVQFEVLAAGGLSLFGLGSPPEDARFSEPASLGEAGVRSADARPNVLLISLDTLRADRLGCYGAEHGTSPAIDALAAGGVRFERAEAASNWTLPSHFSILSGLTPAAHGMLPDLEELRGFKFAERRVQMVSTGREVMLAEALKEAGYHTVAVTEDGWLAGRFGFEQGFDLYRAPSRTNLRETLAAAMAEIGAFGEAGPWFLFVHTYAPHQPYHAPREYRMRWTDSESAGFAWPEARVPVDEYMRFREQIFPPSHSDVRAFRGLYDGQIAWTDSLIESLIGWIDRQALAEQTIVVVLSDHGEEIFERGDFDHGNTLYEEVTRVPLIIRAPGRVPAGRTVAFPVSLIDVPATVLDLVGIRDRHGMGVSLRSAWEAGNSRPAYAQSIGDRSEPIASVWEAHLKYIRRETAGGVIEQLFDLSRDPGESADLVSHRPQDVVRLRALHAAHAEAAAVIRNDLGAIEEELDAETLERLKSLGYAR